jgi:hypothetical protein
MTLSRPLLLALLGALLLGATFYAVQNARTGSTDDTAPAAQAQPEQQAATPAAKPAPAASPEDTLEGAFDLGGVDSTAFAATLSLSAGAERAAVDLSGAFEKGAANDIPKLELELNASAAGEKVEGGFVSLGDKAYFTRGDTGWPVPDEVWGPLVETVRDGSAAQQQALSLPVDPRKWVRDVESAGTQTIEGVETTHVSASIDSERVVEDLVAAARQTGARLPSGADAARVVERAELDAWVGTDDRLLRRLSAEVTFAVPAELRGPDDPRRGEVSIDVRLTGVNEPQEIEAPANVADGLPGGLLGQFAQGLTSGLSSFGAGQPVSLAALSSPNPQRAARAVQAGKRVVVLFRNPAGLDDQAMTKVMRALDRRTEAVVLTDHVDAVDRYGKLVEDLGVSQTPSVVLIDRTGKARLIEGYVDTDTLAQAVADAR